MGSGPAKDSDRLTQTKVRISFLTQRSNGCSRPTGPVGADSRIVSVPELPPVKKEMRTFVCVSQSVRGICIPMPPGKLRAIRSPDTTEVMHSC